MSSRRYSFPQVDILSQKLKHWDFVTNETLPKSLRNVNCFGNKTIRLMGKCNSTVVWATKLIFIFLNYKWIKHLKIFHWPLIKYNSDYLISFNLNQIYISLSQDYISLRQNWMSYSLNWSIHYNWLISHQSITRKPRGFMQSCRVVCHLISDDTANLHVCGVY